MPNILIVDDSATMRRMVRASLRDIADARFIEAGNGLEALEQIALASIDLMTLDLNMPDMHGLEVIQFVRQQPRYRSLPIIVLTTRGDEQSRTNALAVGASDYVTKPFTPLALITRARTLLPQP